MIFWLASLGGLLAMNVTVRQSPQLTLGLLFGFGLLVGLATAPTIAYYASADPEPSGRPAGDGAVRGRFRRRRLRHPTRPLGAGPRALVGAGRAHPSACWSASSRSQPARSSTLGGLVIFAGLVMYDFQRLRATSEFDSAPLLAASIFLDILNVFQFFLSLFGRTRR